MASTLNLRIIVLTFGAFVLLGTTEGLRGVTWPAVSSELRVPLDRLGVLLGFAMTGSLITSFLSGKIMRTFGVWTSARLSLYLMFTGMLGISVAVSWPILVSSSIVMGCGGGLVDASLNTLIAKHSSARVMSWLHASFGLGTTTSVFVVQQLLIRNASWRWGYLLISGCVFSTAVAFLVFRHQDGIMEPKDNQTTPPPVLEASVWKSFLTPGLWIGCAIFFVYAGVEITTGEWAFSVLLFRGIDRVTAAGWLGMYWTAFTVGRIVTGFLPQSFSRETTLVGSMVSVLFSSIGFAFGGTPSIWMLSLVLMGFFLAPIFPLIAFDTEKRVGIQHLHNAVGLQICAGTIGWAAMPALAGFLASATSLDSIPYFIVAASVCVFFLHSLMLRN